MSKSHEFTSSVDEAGRLDPQIAGLIRRYLLTMPGKVVRVNLKEVKRAKTLSQLGYYHAVVLPVITEVLRHHGNEATDDDAHEFVKEHIAKSTMVRSLVLVDKATGEVHRKSIVRSMADTDVGEMSEIIEKCIAFAGQEGFDVPPPT